MKRRAAFIAVLLCAFATSAFAQIPAGGAAPAKATVILGVVSDSAGRPLSGAAVTVKNSSDAAMLTGTLTDSKGRFRIEGLSAGKYRLHFSYIGFKPQQSEVELTAQTSTANLGLVHLATEAIAVQGVTAEAVRSAVTVGVDRNIYTTKNMPAATGGNTTDLLRNVPELDVDVEGNVKLQGSQSVALHINGRPAPMRGDALKNFLQMLPANRVERVEIVPNPSAKYDPEGIAGIVNIVLKDNIDLGTSGSFGASVDSRGRHGVNGSLNYQKGKLTLFGNTAFNLNAASMKLLDERQNLLASPTTFFHNNVSNEMDGHFIFFDGSAEYKLSKLSTAYLSGRINSASNNMDGLQIYQILNAARAPTLWNDWTNDNTFSFANSDFTLGVRRVAVPQQKEMSLEARYNQNGMGQQQKYIKQFLTTSGAATGTPDEAGLTDADTDLGEWSLKGDLTRQLNPKFKLEAGFKGALRSTDYANVLNRFTGTTPIASQSSDYNYDENYQQAYATLSRQFGKVGVQAGARGELATTEFALPNGQSFDNDYNNLFPSLNISYAQQNGLSSRFAYSKRIDRPQPFMLNPGQPSADSLNRQVGNPYLRPKYTHAFTFDFTKTASWGMIKFSPYYRKTTDNWDFFKDVNEQGVSTLTWKNTSSVINYGSNTTLSLRAGTKANGFLSLNTYKYKRDASNISAAYSGDGFRWDISGNGTATLPTGTMVQAFVRYQAPQDMPQGTIKSAVFSNIGLRHQVMNKKASISAGIFDPFDVFRFKFETKDATHIQKSENKVSVRAIRLSFTYNFGKPPTPTARRPEEQQPTEQPPQIR
jgi:hypothetical protein